MTHNPTGRYIIEVIDDTGCWLDYSRHDTESEALLEFVALSPGFPSMRVIDSQEARELARQPIRKNARINPINLVLPRHRKYR